MQTYRETIIATILFISVLLFIALGLMWWISPIAIPSQGMWHCEDLSITLNLESSRNIMIQNLNGVENEYYIKFAYSGAIYYSQSPNDIGMLFGHVCKKLIHSKSYFILELYETGEEYKFKLIE